MKKFFRFLAVAGAMAFSANIAFAQDEMSAADLLSGSEQPLNQALKQKFIEGGPAFMSLIIICLIIGLALAIERILYLSFSQINTKKLVEEVEEALKAGGIEKAKEVCRDTRVSVLKLHPGITEQAVRDILLGDGSRAVILETYGSGNAPCRPWFLALVRDAVTRGKILLNVTQCQSGDVDMNLYATGRTLKDAGVICGHDITTESALGKLFYLMGEYADNGQVKVLLEKNLKGEISK